MSRLVLALLALTALGACVERRTVYRDGSDNDRYAGRGRVVCHPGDKLCYKSGRPSKDATRDMYGKKATRRWWD